MPNEITEGGKKKYPEIAAEIKNALVSATITAQADALRKNPERTNLHNFQRVVSIADGYMSACAGIGLLPSIEGLAANLGVSRRWVYSFIERNPDSQTARYLDRLRLSWAAMRMALVERGVLEPGGALFILKNSRLGMSDHPEENELAEPDREDDRPSWAVGLTDTEYLNRIVAALPDDDMSDVSDRDRYLAEKYIAGAVKSADEGDTET